MSTIKSSTEHLTLNADGSGKDIKFQANGVEKASISSAGAFTSTSIDATKLSGALPAIDGSALTNLPSGGATDIDGLSDGYTDATGVSTGLGTDALANDDGTANQNTACGSEALKANTSGSNNTAFGRKPLYSNQTGSMNTAIGRSSLFSTTGDYNVCVGFQGATAVTTGSSNTALGAYALGNTTSGVYNTAIGMASNQTSATTSYEFTLGHGSINNLRCNDTTISGLSDQRDKAEITDLPEEAGLSLINSLRPVTYFWDRREWYDDGVTDGSKIKRDYRTWKSNSGLRQGFIAQEVETAITGIKCLEDSQVVSGTVDKKEFAPQHLLTNAIKAIQQLSKENESLKIRLTALENV